MSIQPATRSSNQPLGGSSGNWRYRILRFHVPLALASAVVLFLFMSLPAFDPQAYPQESMGSGVFPQAVPQRAVEGGQMDGGPMDMDDGDGMDGAGPMDHGGDQTGSMDQSGGRQRRFFISRVTTATGYVATGFLGLTLLIGPANLLLRRRNPVSNYLRRDVGTWTAIFSVVHVIFGLELHSGGQISAMLNYFVVQGSPLTNSFGLGNWTGLAATVIVVGLLALSTDSALRELKARTWKDLQRLNYTLFALVILHAFFYGALLRVTSPFTLLLGLTVIAVLVGQALGVWLWRRRHARTTARQPAGATE
jgi:methionine sulfoxide reductase heme-binding subunit